MIIFDNNFTDHSLRILPSAQLRSNTDCRVCRLHGPMLILHFVSGNSCEIIEKCLHLVHIYHYRLFMFGRRINTSHQPSSRQLREASVCVNRQHLFRRARARQNLVSWGFFSKFGQNITIARSREFFLVKYVLLLQARRSADETFLYQVCYSCVAVFLNPPDKIFSKIGMYFTVSHSKVIFVLYFVNLIIDNCINIFL